MATMGWNRLYLNNLKNMCKCGNTLHRSYLETYMRHIRRLSKKTSRKCEWQSRVGLEVHAQISSSSKLFSGAATRYGAPVNTQVAFFDAALPGTLPVLNKACVEAGVLTALALGCQISPVSVFDRKHYFYADMPAGYQITQQRQPLAQGGQLSFVHIRAREGERVTAETRTCRLIQLQLEQDSGKSLHDFHCRRSLIDLNRAGIGLMELVTHPDLQSGEDAACFVRELQLLLKTLGTCDGKMQEGSLRVDANISVNRPGEPWGVRTEVKNINSIRNVSKAIDFEIQRQIEILENGGQVENETRGFDAETNETVQMRDKEKLLDYRFMPEPNLPPLHVYTHQRAPSVRASACGAVVMEEVAERLRELPGQIRARVQEQYDIPLMSASLLVTEEGMLEMFEWLVKDGSREVVPVLNMLLNEFLGVLHEHDCSAAECPIPVESLGEVCDMLASREISTSASRKVLSLLFERPELSGREVVEQESLGQIRDRQLIEEVVNEVLTTQPKVMKKLKKGGSRALNAVMGPVQQKLDRRADPRIVTEIVHDIFKRLPR
ncbi:glutamyl-tRNA(Gln) amidotransferase subunit B, mitochondrial-like [Babylonia areolata]|uniref:glutamyl-tRNA(Gln) amidotransferase subunit B, mitochondrial-like n=1 Tax=Babylonia areolata TaxID=304850 RepID=UPI003FD26B46